MGCIQDGKRQPLLNSFDLKGVAERIKSGKCTHPKLVPNAAICVSLILKQTNCSAVVPVFQSCLMTGHQLYLWTALHLLCEVLAKMLVLPAAMQRL